MKISKPFKIKLVSQLLSRYKWARWIPFLKKWYCLEDGMCLAIKQMTENRVSLSDIPEVKQAFKRQMPVTSLLVADKSHGRILYNQYWVRSGQLKPRINILKETLKILQDEQD